MRLAVISGRAGDDNARALRLAGSTLNPASSQKLKQSPAVVRQCRPPLCPVGKPAHGRDETARVPVSGRALAHPDQPIA